MERGIKLKEIYRDRDYLQDEKGDIYQVIGSLHPENGLYALQKYKRVEFKSEEAMENFLAQVPRDPISKVKNHPLRFWVQKHTGDNFVRILPNYSSKSAENNMKNHPYAQKSTIFQMDMIQVPHEAIEHHWKPQEKLLELQTAIQSNNFKEKRQLDSLHRKTLEVTYSLEAAYNINVNQVGITGSILWNSHHEKSDIDLMVYGKENIRKMRSSSPKQDLSPTSKGLRNFLKVEMMPLAEKLSIKTGLPLEECFEYVYRKPHMYFYNNIKVSITFAPTVLELPTYPLFTKNTIFQSMQPAKIKARVLDSSWGAYYPSLFEIECLDIDYLKKSSKEKKMEKIRKENLKRLLVYEHELVGYYGKNDVVEIRGLLQMAKNVPNYSTLHEEDCFQVLVGGKETFGSEYVRIMEQNSR